MRTNPHKAREFQYLENLVLRCGEPQLPTAAATQLFDLINEIKFVDYTLTTAEQHTFFQRFAGELIDQSPLITIIVSYMLLAFVASRSVICSRYVRQRSSMYVKFIIIDNHCVTIDTTVRNKAVLLGILMDELGIPATDTIETYVFTHSNSISRF